MTVKDNIHKSIWHLYQQQWKSNKIMLYR